MEITSQDRETLIMLTSDIVAAHVSHNNIATEDMPGLITQVFSALSDLGSKAEEVEAIPEAAVSIRASVKPDHVTCLECGKPMKMLKRHLTTDHGLTADEYRKRRGLAADHPLVAPNYAAKRAELAKKIGLGRKPAAASKGAPVNAAIAAAPPKPKARRGRKPKPASAPAGKASAQADGATRSSAAAKSKSPARTRTKRNGKLGLKFNQASPAPATDASE